MREDLGKTLSPRSFSSVSVMLYRASMVDTRSIIGTIASKRLIELAIAEDPDLLREDIETRDQCVAGMGRVDVHLNLAVFDFI